MDSPDKVDVFISHSFAQGDAAKEIAEACQQKGLNVFDPAAHLEPARRWEDQIAEAIRSAKVYVVLVDDQTDAHDSRLSREWSEIQRAIWDKADAKVLPVLLDPSSSLPPFLRLWQSLSVAEDWPSTATGSEVASRILSGSTGAIHDRSLDDIRNRFAHLAEEIDRLAETEVDE